MNAFALYRLPHAGQCTLIAQTEGEPQSLPSCAALNGCSGFVVAPFAISGSQPLLLIAPQQVSTFPVGDLRQGADCLHPADRLAEACRSYCSEPPAALQEDAAPDGADRRQYTDDFDCFHTALEEGKFKKLVLARSAAVRPSTLVDPVGLFLRACDSYPRLFVSLVYTPASGMWLTATPEILLEGVGGRWRTIALAGTMQLQGDELQGEGEQLCWSTKNIREQRVVATYIADCLERFSIDYCEEGPRTVRAAHLVHLRSDFSFTLFNNVRVGDLLDALHPTPAVCGLPKREALDFILAHEHTSRNYYSGFMGPLCLSPSADSTEATHLYVSLRCMHIGRQSCRLYAGGGLLEGSVAEQEWQETEAKMQTMRALLNSH